ncbi:MAG: hypothetical protein V1725_06650 [archaeon]
MTTRASGLEKTVGGMYNTLPKPLKHATNAGLYGAAGAVICGLLPIVTVPIGLIAGVGLYGYKTYSKYKSNKSRK